MVSDNQFPTFDAESKYAKSPMSHYGWGGWSVTTNFQKSTSNFQSPKSQTEISISDGGGGGVVTNRMHGIWCCHLVYIWGELTNFDNKICNFRSAFASQIVSLWKLKSMTRTKI